MNTNTERDELAQVIITAYGEDADVECPCEQDWELTDAIIAAGYRKPRIITTAEELNALWIETVVRSSGQTIWEKGDYEEDSKGLTWWISPGDSRAYPVHQITLPATVLFDPETDK